MSGSLEITRFGNPVLRKKAKLLTDVAIKSKKVQKLILQMHQNLSDNKHGVGLAAPQIGKSIALSVIDIKPTDARPNLKSFSTVFINPEIIEVYEPKSPKWEGCISCGTGDDTLFAKVPRYSKVKLSWIDADLKHHVKVLGGFLAHVAQHEVDHLNGVLFTDRVEDKTSYMMIDEYYKRVVSKRKK